MLTLRTKRPSLQRSFRDTTYMVAAFGALCLGIPNHHLQAQISQPWSNWQKEAGSKQSFQVASVRQSLPDSHRRDNIDLGPRDSFSLPAGLFSTNVSLDSYIIFAYKIADGSQYPSLSAQLPKWAKSPAKFDVEARAAGHPSKDQLRLMMQTLLEDRFKLAIHTETKQLPVYALVLDNPGRTGPQLRAHRSTLPCPEIPTVAVQGPEPPPVCGLMQTWMDGGLFHLRMMNVPMDVVAGTLVPFLGGLGGLDNRPSIDRTGLTGKFDFTLAFQPEPQPSPEGSADPQPERTGPTLTESLGKQLGLKLLKQDGPVNAFVIDHLEMPSEN